MHRINTAQRQCHKQDGSAHLLAGSDVPHGHQAVVSAAQHMQLVSREPRHVHRCFVALELPQKGAAARVEHLHAGGPVSVTVVAGSRRRCGAAATAGH